MSTVPFPILNSGAVAQYPLPLTLQGSAETILFLDGSDQRFIRQGRMLRAWEVQLSLLTEAEIQAVELFFQSLYGQYAEFDFPDPYSGSTVSNCRLGAPDLISVYVDVDVTASSFWVVETNG